MSQRHTCTLVVGKECSPALTLAIALGLGQAQWSPNRPPTQSQTAAHHIATAAGGLCWKGNKDRRRWAGMPWWGDFKTTKASATICCVLRHKPPSVALYGCARKLLVGIDRPLSPTFPPYSIMLCGPTSFGVFQSQHVPKDHKGQPSKHGYHTPTPPLEVLSIQTSECPLHVTVTVVLQHQVQDSIFSCGFSVTVRPEPWIQPSIRSLICLETSVDFLVPSRMSL